MNVPAQRDLLFPVPGKKTRAVGFTLATWFGVGLLPGAPGTFGTIAALPLYFLVRGRGPLAVLAASVIVTFVGVWAASVVVDTLGKKDPQIVVIDEVAGVLLTLTVAPHRWCAVVAGVVLFRIFDQFKPWPARAFERGLPRGWGVVMDDVAAGAWGAAILFALVHFEVL